MRFDDYTDMGGVRDEFLTTHWSVIEDVGLSGDDKNHALIGLLIETYWKPVYCYLRRRGYGNEQAKDLAQGFFQEVVLGRKLIEKAEQTKGRFRSFLLVALNRYVIDIGDEQAAQKRIPNNKLVSLDWIDSLDLPEPAIELDPEDCFNYAWISDFRRP
jgi:RNA polymerase sigma-70 factor (ECF subfamily)